MVAVDEHRAAADRATRGRAARAADRRLAGALRLGGLAALLWPLTTVLSARWVIGPLLASLVTWSLLRVRQGFGDRVARRRLDRCLDLVLVADAFLLVQIMVADHPAYSVPWPPALALAAAVRYAGAVRDEAASRGHRAVAAGLNRGHRVLAVALLPTYLVIAWGPFALHRRSSSGGLPVAGTWYAADQGWVLALGAVVILLGIGLAALTVAGHRFRIALSDPRSGSIKCSPSATTEHP